VRRRGVGPHATGRLNEVRLRKACSESSSDKTRDQPRVPVKQRGAQVRLSDQWLPVSTAANFEPCNGRYEPGTGGLEDVVRDVVCTS
jgi:hypothetical protein